MKYEFDHSREEFFRRAMVYWELFTCNAYTSQRDHYLENYYFWYLAYTDGKDFARKACNF